LLDEWAKARTQFVKVFPSDYKKALGASGEQLETKHAVAV
jgi:glutamate synthase domain-containing protein 3